MSTTRPPAAPAPPARAVRSSPKPAAASQAALSFAATEARLQGGKPLPPSTRERMESLFQTSFREVRVHTGGVAGEVTRANDAEALTVGPKIAFAPGRYDPQSAGGSRLLAHELAHVAQQANSVGGAMPDRSLASQPGEPAEHAADDAAARVSQGRPALVGGHSQRHRIMRKALAKAAPGPVEITTTAPDAKGPVAAPVEAPGARDARTQEQAEEVRKKAVEMPPANGTTQFAASPPAVSPAPTEEPSAAAPEAEASAGASELEAAPESAAAPPMAEHAPASAAEDPAFQEVTHRAHAVAEREGAHPAPKEKAAQAQAAAKGPPNEVAAAAAGNQVGKMAEQKPAPFDREAFKKALFEKVDSLQMANLEDADKFKERDTAGQLKSAVTGEVESGKATAQGPIAQTATEPPSENGVEAKPVVPQPPTVAGPPPPDLGAAAAAPKPKSEAEVNLDAGPRSLDEKMAGAGVTDATLANSNEPAFLGAQAARDEAREHAATAPEAYRQDEAALVQGASAQAEATAQSRTGAMHDRRSGQFGKVEGAQDSTRTDDEAKRAEVTTHIQGIFDETRQKVQDRLKTVDEEVNTEFDAGASAAAKAFETEVEVRKEDWKSERYDRVGGSLLWLKDLVLPLPDEVNQIYVIARKHYLDAMAGVIDRVATIVETGLRGATELIQAGHEEVTKYVGSLSGDLKKIGEEAASAIQAEFDKLGEEVSGHEKALIDDLAKKYADQLKTIDDRIGAMKKEDEGLLGVALDAIEGVIETILQIKEMLLGILAKAAAIIDTIIADPIGFLGNLITGLTMGFKGFVANIGQHLKDGLMGWLFGAISAAGITVPEKFDLQGLLSLGAQILGLTYQNIRARAVKIVGEPVVKAMETAVEIFQILMTQGLGGVWNYIKEMLGNLAETVISGIRDWVATKVITAGITWILSLLNPASAFIRACKLIIDVVMFFVERGAQIISLVNAVLDSIAAIASGSLGAMAAAVEAALARSVPIAISFLASLLGLGGISDVIRKNIERIQAPVNKAIDWLIGKAVKIAKSIGGLFGGKKKKDEKETPETDDPEHDAKVEAGLAALRKADQQVEKDGHISHENAEKVAAQIKKDHPIFKSLRVKDGKTTWNYVYLASPEVEVTGEEKDGSSLTEMKEVKVVFNIRVAKFNPVPYRGQLRQQERGIRDMKMEAWAANKNQFLAARAATGSGRSDESAEDQKKFREEMRNRIVERRTQQAAARALAEGRKPEPEKDLAAAEAFAEAWMSSRAALHGPDQIAGGGRAAGDTAPSDTGDLGQFKQQTGLVGMGDARINSSIGSQWRTRAGAIDTEVKAPIYDGLRQKFNMNVVLAGQEI